MERKFYLAVASTRGRLEGKRMEDLFLGKQTGKVISFEDYCRSRKEQEEEESSLRLAKRSGTPKFYTRLELLCLLLEAGVRVSLLFWILGSIQRPFSR